MPLPPSSRRDLLRYGAAAVGAAAVGLAAQPAEAADGDPIIIGALNTGTVSTLLDARDAPFGAGFQANGRFEGVVGLAFGANGFGVFGNHVGIFGTFQQNVPAVGVFGTSAQPFGTGVLGRKMWDRHQPCTV